MMEDSVLIAAGIVGYLMCSVVTYGILFAYAQGEYPMLAEQDRFMDRAMAMFFSLFGPVGLLFAYLGTGFAKHGWRL